MIELHDIFQLSAATVAVIIALSAWLKRTGAADSELTSLRKEFEAHQVSTDRRHQEMSAQLQGARLKMAEEYVTKSDLSAMEGRLVQHINMVLSAVGCPIGPGTTTTRKSKRATRNGDDEERTSGN